jgi:hypothetical protein
MVSIPVVFLKVCPQKGHKCGRTAQDAILLKMFLPTQWLLQKFRCPAYDAHPGSELDLQGIAEDAGRDHCKRTGGIADVLA